MAEKIILKKKLKIPETLLSNYLKETNAKKNQITTNSLKLILYINNKPVAFISGEKKRNKEGLVLNLKHLFVNKEYRRQGYAKKLFYYAGNYARKKGFVGLDLENMLNKTQNLIKKEEKRLEKKAKEKGKKLVLFRKNKTNSSIDKEIRFVPRILKNKKNKIRGR
jgi:GNAT superfamily N-acetyltransferase